MRSYAVRNLPPRWTAWDTAKLIGDPFIDKLRMPCPSRPCWRSNIPTSRRRPRARASSSCARPAADSRSARWMPQLKDQSREWEYVQEQLRQGQKLVRVYYGVTSFSPFGKGDAHERNLKAIYKSAGWELQDERYMQIRACSRSCR
jgi:conjugal transfer ATP-binding protein TraC